MFTKHRQILAALSLAVGAILTAATTRADITFTGSVNPANPTTWTSGTSGYVGYSADGSIAVTNDSDLVSNTVYLGNTTGATGTVSIDGIGSTWKNYSSLILGASENSVGVLNITNGGFVTSIGGVMIGANQNKINLTQNNIASTGIVTVDGLGSKLTVSDSVTLGSAYGTGVLNITNGGMVQCNEILSCPKVGNSGSINFGNNGGTLNTNSLIASATHITGTGTINANGLVSDIDLILDSAQSLSRTLSLGNVTLNLYLNQNSSGALGVGYLGSANLTITNGVSVISRSGNIGYLDGSWGTATVDGAGSAWMVSGALDIRHGSLSVLNGGYLYARSINLGTEGSIHFDVTGKTINTRELYFKSPAQLAGTGNINVTGLGNQDLRFDATHGLKQTFHYGDVNVNLTMGALNETIIGMDGTGSWTIADGFKLTNGVATLGQNVGSTGTIIVTGAGSTLTSYGLWFGVNGRGVMNITKGGVVNTDVCYLFSPTSRINIDGTGSILNSNKGLATYGGILNVTNGGVVNCTTSGGSIGFATTQDGATVNLKGNGSTISTHGDLYVGYSGIGVLNIQRGGVLNILPNGSGTGITYIGAEHNLDGYPSSYGIINIDGTGSQWITSQVSIGGGNGRGIVNITNGATVNSSGIFSIYKNSLLTIDAGVGSSLVCYNGKGSISNSGTIRVVAGPRAALGTFVPTSAISLFGTGTIQALGGVWNSVGHSITIRTATLGTAGAATNIDLSVTQRLLLTDSKSGKKVGAGFAATTKSTNLNFMATLASADELASLQSVVGGDQAILSGWDFVASGGYTAGDPAYLSLELATSDAELSADKLTVWHFDGTNWTKYATPDLSYDGTYASFTVTGFSGYAVTATVPEPATALLLGIGMLSLLNRPRRT